MKSQPLFRLLRAMMIIAWLQPLTWAWLLQIWPNYFRSFSLLATINFQGSNPHELGLNLLRSNISSIIELSIFLELNSLHEKRSCIIFFIIFPF